ncbi:MAG: hypothetical protein K2H02_04360 [Anaeroplasmataceae bacterium]|nr:hypothetical protein [Anaeroplasmataceae bacterium]
MKKFRKVLLGVLALGSVSLMASCGSGFKDKNIKALVNTSAEVKETVEEGVKNYYATSDITLTMTLLGQSSTETVSMEVEMDYEQNTLTMGYEDEEVSIKFENGQYSSDGGDYVDQDAMKVAYEMMAKAPYVWNLKEVLGTNSTSMTNNLAETGINLDVDKIINKISSSLVSEVEGDIADGNITISNKKDVKVKTTATVLGSKVKYEFNYTKFNYVYEGHLLKSVETECNVKFTVQGISATMKMTNVEKYYYNV